MRILLLFLLVSAFFGARAQVANIDSLQEIVRSNRQDAGECQALVALGVEYTRSDLGKARTCLYDAIGLAGRLKDDLALSNAWYTMMTVEQNTGHNDSAVVYLQKVEILANATSKPAIRANFHAMAGLFYKRQNNFKAALPYLIASAQDAERAEKENHSPAGATALAGQYLNIGNTYTKLGDYRSALSYHLKGLRTFEEVDNKKGLSFCYQGIASDFLNLNQLRAATDYTRRSIALKTELNDKRGLATASAQLAEISLRQRQYDLAIKEYSEAVKTFHEMKLGSDEALAEISIGKIYGLKKDSANAELFLQNARGLALSLKDSTLLTAADAESAALETTLRKQREAEGKLTSSLQSSIETGDKGRELQSYQYLADYYTSNRQFDKALVYTNKLHQVSDSLQNQQLQVQLSRMEKQYSLDKKEREIELLKKDQQLDHANLQRQKNVQIAGVGFLVLLLVIGFLIINRYRVLNKARRMIEMERMRNTIARDLHDDIGSMLSSINILSKMTIEQAKGEPVITPNLQKIKDRSAAIMESMGDIVWAINPANDTIDKMIHHMKEFTGEMLDPLDIDYAFTAVGEVSAVELDVIQRKDLYLIFKEAINNAAKYSGCTRLRVELKKEHSILWLTVTDNGKGFDLSTVRAGNGLANMRERARSLNAAVAIDTSPGEGTAIRVEIPINNI
jgi:signal transduction histidine kinase